VRCACIDVGSNTTRLLVADSELGEIEAVHDDRVFTLIGRSLDGAGRIPPAKVDETAAVVARQAGLAEERGAEQIRAVATAAIRLASNAPDLVAAVERRAGIELEVLTGEEEAELAFHGAASAVGEEGRLAVIDVGGGSTEIAVGTAAGGVESAESISIGSSVLAERHLRADPPSEPERAALRDEIARALDHFEPPTVDLAVAVGGSASSLLHLAGRELGPDALERAVTTLCSEPAGVLSERFRLEPVRVRLLPAGALVLAELARRIGQPLRICRGGLREGVILEMAVNNR
jgi:exopolyphosphatase/guanosine-5'-triphosphate,3'-diphosphate pyrophosphatase